MSTPLKHRLAAAVASLAVTITLFSAVAAFAEPPSQAALLARADTGGPR